MHAELGLEGEADPGEGEPASEQSAPSEEPATADAEPAAEPETGPDAQDAPPAVTSAEKGAAQGD